jgi:hypothetical protein
MMRRAVIVAVSIVAMVVALAPATSAGGPSFAVTPEAAAPGDEITFNGTCEPSDTVQYGFGPAGDFSLSNDAQADGSGNWTGTLVIPADAVPGGDYEVGAECGSDPFAQFLPFDVLPDGRIVLVKTVSTVADECGSEREIVVPRGTTVYYCYTVTNETDFTLGVHTLVDDPLGTIFTDLEYDLAPGTSVDTVSAGVEVSAVINETTINGAVWTAEAVIVGAAPIIFEADAGAVVTVGDVTTTTATGAAAAAPRFTG